MLLEVSVLWLVGYFMTLNSRSCEFAADRYSVERGYAISLKHSLISLHVKNAANLVPDELYANYHFSHPGLVERLAAIDDYMAKLCGKKTPEAYIKHFESDIRKVHGNECFEQ